MKIINLIENTPGAKGCLYEHGLSFYIETAHHKVILDTGAGRSFLYNAEVLGIDPGKADLLILSHGHYDHGGGIPAFAAAYPDIPIYMQRTAAEAYVHLKDGKEKYIGLPPEAGRLPQCVLLDGDKRIDDELSLFTGITGRKYWPRGNQALKITTEDGYKQDDFRHEQCLAVTENNRYVLLSGCAHNGILNILDRYREMFQRLPDVLISGFHMKQDSYGPEDLEVIRHTARILKDSGILCFTGHCTGQTAFTVMKEIMGDSLQAVHSGNLLLEDL